MISPHYVIVAKGRYFADLIETQNRYFADLIETQMRERRKFISDSKTEFMSAMGRYFAHEHMISEEQLSAKRMEVIYLIVLKRNLSHV